MGVSAKALLTSNPSPLEVMYFLDGLNHVTDVNIKPDGLGDFVYINFKWSGEQRYMATFDGGVCREDYKHVYPLDSTLCFISAWGMSEAIVYTLVEHFKGFYCFSDATGDWVRII